MPVPNNVIAFGPVKAAALQERGDDDLMALWANGVTAAFEALVHRHQDALLRVAHKQLGDLTLARDAAQNTFLELHRHLPRFQPQGRFRAYLYTIHLNQCRLLGKRRSAEQRRSHNLALRVVPLDPQVPVDVLLRAEEHQRVAKSVATLSHKVSAVVVLRFAADLSHQDIAQVLRIPVGTVKSRLFAGLVELRRLMQREAP